MEFSLAEVRDATGGELLAGAEALCLRVTIDSRQVKPGDLFIAIPGERYDGHQFVPAAAAAGAGAVLVSRRQDVPPGVGQVLVDDTIQALGALARAYRRRFTLPVVAVTGSTGKTSTKEMIARVGAVRHRVARTPGNQNNEIGLPLTLLGLVPGDELLVLEMGMRGQGQIATLAAIAEPEVGVLTNIGLTHLELLGSREAIAEAKAELLAVLPIEGYAVLNADDPRCLALTGKTRAQVLLYGLGVEAVVRAMKLKESAEGSRFTVVVPGWPEFAVELSVPGRHHVSNALAAIATAKALGYAPEDVRAGLADFGLERGRGMAIATIQGWTVIDDTYNASPASAEAALGVLGARPAVGRRIAVLGDMLELGSAAMAGHRSVGECAAGIGISLLLTTGELACEIVAGAVAAGFPATMARHYPTQEQLVRDLTCLLRQGDVVLVKGSRGMRMEKIVAALVKE